MQSWYGLDFLVVPVVRRDSIAMQRPDRTGESEIYSVFNHVHQLTCLKLFYLHCLDWKDFWSYVTIFAVCTFVVEVFYILIFVIRYRQTRPSVRGKGRGTH